jgi:hypothetical protein
MYGLDGGKIRMSIDEYITAQRKGSLHLASQFPVKKAKANVMGTCRGGTTWFTLVLKRAGLKLEHEQMSQDGGGICSGFYWIDHDWYIGPHPGLLSAWEFERYYQLVRDPRYVAASLGCFYRPNHSIYEWYKSLGVAMSGDKHVDALRCWLFTHSQIATLPVDLAWRLEDTEQVWEVIAQDLNLNPVMPEIAVPNSRNQDFNRSKVCREFIPWDELYKMDRKTTRAAEALWNSFEI